MEHSGGMMLERVKRRINVLIWGTDALTCAECGAAVSPSKALWSGRETYCSTEHEFRDHEAVGWTAAAPSPAATQHTHRSPTAVTTPTYRHAA